MGAMIKAIETEYNGYRFRSRLEARWAVFFDQAGITYEYEPEGFELEDGTRYLPDFYLPWFHCYVEIKPLETEAFERGKECVNKLFDAVGDCAVMLCVGDPMEDFMAVRCDYCDENGSEKRYVMVRFVEGCWWGTEEVQWGHSKHHIDMIAYDYYEYGTFDPEHRLLFRARNGKILPIYGGKNLYDCRSDLEYAKKAARQARFEWGESGGVS